MATETINLTIQQGATFSQVITPVVPVDYTGFTGNGQIREQCDPRYPVLAELSVAVAVGTVGIHTISLTATQTASLPVYGATSADTKLFVYDIELTSGATIIRADQGSVTVSPEVTK